MSIRIRMRSGIPAASVLALALLAGCNYGLRGGGGFPAHIRTIYIAPFENETAQFDLERQLFEQLLSDLPRQLGIRPAPESEADAVLRGSVVRYDDRSANYRPGQQQVNPQVLSNEIRIGISAELIDVRRNLILWDGSLTGQGTYQQGENDTVGQEEAIQNLVEQIIDAAQSQW